MLTLETCEKIADTSNQLLEKPILKIADPLARAVRSVLIRQIAIVDQIGAILQDSGNAQELEIVLDTLLIQGGRLGGELAQKFRP